MKVNPLHVPLYRFEQYILYFFVKSIYKPTVCFYNKDMKM